MVARTSSIASRRRRERRLEVRALRVCVVLVVSLQNKERKGVRRCTGGREEV
jgi:hypothetical protein